MDQEWKDLIDEAIRYYAAILVLENNCKTKMQHDALWDLKQKYEHTAEKIFAYIGRENEA